MGKIHHLSDSLLSGDGIVYRIITFYYSILFIVIIFIMFLTVSIQWTAHPEASFQAFRIHVSLSLSLFFLSVCKSSQFCQLTKSGLNIITITIDWQFRLSLGGQAMLSSLLLLLLEDDKIHRIWKAQEMRTRVRGRWWDKRSNNKREAKKK